MTPQSVRSQDIRALLATSRWTAIGWRLGMLDLIRTRDERNLVGHLGPDLLGADWDAQEAAGRVHAQRSRTIGAALLDQRNLAGLGTIWTTETLFACRINPWISVGSIGDETIARVMDVAHRLLHGSIVRAEYADTAAAYGHVGEPCPRCTTLLRNGPVGEPPNVRTLVYCPRCQASS